MQRGFSSLMATGFIFLILSLYQQPALAGKVVKVKGKKVYIKLSKSEASSIEKGDKVYLTTKSGKKKGIVKIRSLKGRKALARLSKGKARRGYRTRVKKSKPKPDNNDYATGDSSGSVVSEDSQNERPDMLFGILAGYGLASQTVIQSASSTSDQTGSSIAVKGILDYSLFDDIGVRVQAGIEMFSVKGTGLAFPSNTPGNIGTDITYLSIDILLRWYVARFSSFSLYLTPGVGINSPMSTETNSLNEESISTTSIVILGGGLAFPIGKMEIFAGADYYYFPASAEVTTSVISFKAGLLFDF